MRREKKFKPVKGVKIDNCLRYITAVEEAVFRDVKTLSPKYRSFALTSIKYALRLAERRIDALRKELEADGEAVALTRTQLHQFAMVIKSIKSDDKLS